MANTAKQEGDIRGTKKESKFLLLLVVILVAAVGLTTRYEKLATIRFLWLGSVFKLLLPAVIATYGIKKGSLDTLGGAFAFFVGTIHGLTNFCFSFSLIIFFIAGSWLSKWNLQVKKAFEPSEDPGPRRNWKQVLCNGGVSSVASLLYLTSSQHYWKTYFSLAVLSSISCCCGDTFASEFGSVVDNHPRLITTLCIVPRGTNGGVSLAGTLASLGGGMLIGLAYYFTQQVTFSGDCPLVIVLATATLGGVLGSLVDSLLGATLQYTGYNTKTGRISHSLKQDSYERHVSGLDILSNNQVNLLSSLVTGIVIPLLVLNLS